MQRFRCLIIYLFNNLIFSSYDVNNNLINRLIFDVSNDVVESFVIDRIVDIMTIDVILINDWFVDVFDDFWVFDDILSICRFDDIITCRLIKNLICRDYFLVEFEREYISSYWITRFWQSFKTCKKYYTLCFES